MVDAVVDGLKPPLAAASRHAQRLLSSQRRPVPSRRNRHSRDQVGLVYDILSLLQPSAWRTPLGFCESTVDSFRETTVAPLRLYRLLSFAFLLGRQCRHCYAATRDTGFVREREGEGLVAWSPRVYNPLFAPSLLFLLIFRPFPLEVRKPTT